MLIPSRSHVPKSLWILYYIACADEYSADWNMTPFWYPVMKYALGLQIHGPESYDVASL